MFQGWVSTVKKALLKFLHLLHHCLLLKLLAVLAVSEQYSLVQGQISVVKVNVIAIGAETTPQRSVVARDCG